MRVTNKADLERLTKGGELGQSGISSWASRQIERALAESSGAKVPRERRPESTAGGKGAPKKRARQVVGESPGEAAVRLALISAFGDWHKGGEVVAELMPFRTRRFRTDNSLPRWRIAVEIDGWSNHGEHLSDHISDRERGLFFASHDWLTFRVAHGQAINNPGMLVDAIANAMNYRQPVDRQSIQLEEIPHKHGIWYRLV